MNCSDFEQRMQHLIDEDLSLVDDDLLAAHAQWCDQCHERMVLWQQIDSVLLEDSSRPTAIPRRSAQKRVAIGTIITAVAAILLLAFFASLPNDDVVATTTAFRPPEAEDQHAAVDPVLWWRNVQDQDWIGQTMPAVHSVRDGVAPLGRSLLQAVAILAAGRGESTS